MRAFLRFLVSVSLAATAVSVSTASPLFDEEASLTLTIEAPMRELIKKRRDKPEYDAVVRYTDSSGQEVVLNARLMSRGNTRLDVCDFPPLRLDLKKSETVGTVFEGQNRLKMVTQCNRSGDARNWLLQELGIYRAYNIITDYSYRARRLDVNYVDSSSSRWKRSRPAFFIESTGGMADRLDLDSVRPPTIEPNQFQQAQLANNLLFQLLVANTDFSAKRGPASEGCCHNGRVLTKPGQQKNWIVVPYDFDQAGIINTDYALPDARLKIRSVNNRLYRGFCWQNDSLPDAMDIFRERRETITTALIPAEFSSSRQKRSKRFVDRFYKIIDDPKELQKRIVDKCRGAATFPIRKTTTPGV
jgi:hypothetical protein